MHPCPELVQRDDWRTRYNLIIARTRPDYSQAQRSVTAYHPVDGSRLKSVAHKERIDLAIQPLHANPGCECQRLEFPGNSQADTIADTLKFQRPLLRPATFRPLAADDGRF